MQLSVPINPTIGFNEAFSLASAFFGFNFTIILNPTVSHAHSRSVVSIRPSVSMHPPISYATFSINPTIRFNEAFSLASAFFGFNFTIILNPTVSHVLSLPAV
jgi:hypothetical protein